MLTIVTLALGMQRFAEGSSGQPGMSHACSIHTSHRQVDAQSILTFRQRRGIDRPAMGADRPVLARCHAQGKRHPFGMAGMGISSGELQRHVPLVFIDDSRRRRCSCALPGRHAGSIDDTSDEAGKRDTRNTSDCARKATRQRQFQIAKIQPARRQLHSIEPGE